MTNERFEQEPLILPGDNPDLQSIDLARFPLIDDFQVTFEKWGPLGKHVIFRSPSKGILASFDGWDHADRDLSKMEENDIPCGTMYEPFGDCEQSWPILIFENDEWVYVLEGGETGVQPFHSWFKVRKELYVASWLHLVGASRGELPG